jgi:hypothetical protein
MTVRRKSLAIAAILALVATARGATSLTGSTGLLFVPTAGVRANECFSFGGVITDYQAFPAKHFGEFRADRPSFYFGGYLAIGYIPGLEITVRGNGMPDTKGPAADVGPYYTDGMISAQALLYRGEGAWPSIGVGLQDIYGFMLFNAMYAVLTWRVPSDNVHALEITVGWAVDWYDTHRGTSDVDFDVVHIMDGPLFGVEFPVGWSTAAIAEYDSRSLNLGFRVRPAEWYTIDLAVARWGLDQLARRRVRGFAAQLHFDGPI